MNLFGRRARIVELPSGSGGLATGLYVGSAAGLASGGWDDDDGAAADGDQPVTVGHDDSEQLAPGATVDSGSSSVSESQAAVYTSWSGNDGFSGGDFSGGWSGGDFSGG